MVKMFHNKSELCDVISALIYCPDDQTFLLLLDEARGDYWIPSMKMDPSLGWKDNLRVFKNQLFDYEIINNKLLKIFKIWTVEKEYFHLIFQLNLPKEIKTKCKTETKLGRVGWYTCGQLTKKRPFLRSLELLEIIHTYVPKYQKDSIRTGEAMAFGCLTEVRESDILISNENAQSQVHLDLLESARLPPSEQYGLYEQFFLATYPCLYMNKVAFKKAIDCFRFPGDIAALFRAADVWKRNFLTFQDYLYLIAVMDPYTAHSGDLGEIRCQYIFRYYNEKGDGKLSFKDFSNLITDILQSIHTNSANMNANKNIESLVKTIDFRTNSSLTFDKFYSYVTQGQINDPTRILRFEQSYFELPVAEEKDFSHYGLSKLLLSSDSRLQKGQTTSAEYSIMVKPIILKPGDTPLQFTDMKVLEEAMTKSVSEDFRMSDVRLVRLNSLDLDMKVNELLMALRYFCSEICDNGEFEFEKKKSYSWGSAYLEKLGVTLIMMCEQVKEILKAEPRMLELEPPVYIMGDLHGNFHDLICFEKTLWSNGTTLSPAKFLFLGDYVDRGINSVEVVMYLFANKIQNPSKFFLIRGNHEIREIQKMFTFQSECTLKFGNTLGMTIWKAVNEAFDRLPLAAVIDRRVFCCHGGIPPPWLCPILEVINLIPCPLVNCEKQSPLAWTLMWNDPIRSDSHRQSDQAMELVVNEGFIPNVLRGTAFAFSCDALEKFLKTNNLTHVVRAHEVVKAGFQIHQKGKLLTVFSSSGYCGGNNYAGSVLVADKFLKVFMVDTRID